MLVTFGKHYTTVNLKNLLFHTCNITECLKTSSAAKIYLNHILQNQTDFSALGMMQFSQ